MSVRTVGVGQRVGRDQAGRTRTGTLAELEVDLEHVRAMGAPDDARIALTAPGSVYAAEVLWIEPEPAPGPS